MHVMLASAAMESIAQILFKIIMGALLALAMTNSKDMVLTVPILTSVPTTPTIARRMDYVQIHSAALNALVTQDSVAMELNVPTSTSVLPVLTIVKSMLIALT